MDASAVIPRFLNSQQLRVDPLAFLQAAQSVSDGLVVVSEKRPVFSRAPDCVLVVAVFGPEGIRQVLSDPETFGTVMSAGELLSLPPSLVRLNAGLFSMCGEQHKDHQQLLRPMFNAEAVHDHRETIVNGWNSFLRDLRIGQEVFLLSEMRRLVLHVSDRIVFGEDGLTLGKLVQSYFDLRRAMSGHQAATDLALRQNLIRQGARLARTLRAKLAALRSGKAAGTGASLLERMAGLYTDGERQLTDQELIAHANVLFMSSSEPVAAALTWTLLLLSQQPELCSAIRRELAAALSEGEVPSNIAEAQLPLLTGVIQESLRLMPPSAIMVRLTTRSVRLLEYELPARCEVVLSPYIAHRDPSQYMEPDLFDPYRWQDLHPAAFSYFPFGSGARFCLGRQLARFTLLSILARIIARYEVVLAEDQEIDWTMNIALIPTRDPVVRFLPLFDENEKYSRGRLTGPVAALVRWRSARNLAAANGIAMDFV